MRLKKIILGGLLLSLSFPLFAQNVAMGHWRTHFASTAIHSVFDEGNRIYAASSTGLFYVDLRDNTLSQISKIQGLSGIDISKAGYHKPTGQILVCYADGNIDILDGARVINIPDIKRKNISGDKTIHTIFWKNQYAYLACGFGIVVLDMSRREIKDSYFIGENSTALSIYDVGIDENLIYAATAKGIYYASSSSPNLSDYKNWTLDTVLPASKQQQAFSLLRKVGATYIAVTIDTQKSKDLLYRGEIAKKWSQWDETNVNAVSNICVQSKDFLRITKGNAGYWEIGLYDFDFNLAYVKKINFGDPNRVKPREALTKKEVLWIGQGDGALNASENKGSSNNWYAIQGPSSNDAYALSQGKHSLLMCAGGLALDFRPEYRFFQCSKFEDNTWSWFNANIEEYKDLRSSTDATSAQEDPLKEGHIFISSALNGLWEFQDNQIVNHYTPKNSALQYFQGDSSNGCRINSIAFDYAGNLWISNSGAVDAMVVKRLDGTWQSYSISTLFSQEIGEIMVDYWNQKWILGRGGKLFVFKEDAPQSKILSVDINRGNELEVSMVNCMIEDEDGFIWIGTERGVRVIYTNAKMFENPIGTVSSVVCI
ncbi:MAG: two-component regulator propeller domain-containing protein [Bacteroidales bacterium]